MQWQRCIYPYNLFYSGNLQRDSFASEKCNFMKRFVDRGLPGSLPCKRLSQRKTARINIVLSYRTSNIFYKSKLRAFISQRSMREEENRSVKPWILQVLFLMCLLVPGFCCLLCSFFWPTFTITCNKNSHFSPHFSKEKKKKKVVSRFKLFTFPFPSIKFLCKLLIFSNLLLQCCGNGNYFSFKTKSEEVLCLLSHWYRRGLKRNAK